MKHTKFIALIALFTLCAAFTGGCVSSLPTSKNETYMTIGWRGDFVPIAHIVNCLSFKISAYAQDGIMYTLLPKENSTLWIKKSFAREMVKIKVLAWDGEFPAGSAQKEIHFPNKAVDPTLVWEVKNSELEY